MLIVKADQWNKATTELEKFAIERILQRCDFSEIISNKHRTINGYTQLKELLNYCELTLNRSKTIKTLVTIIEEAKSPIIPQNISSDVIVANYFNDTKSYFDNFDEKKLLADKGQPNTTILENFKQQLRIFEEQFDSYYYAAILREFNSIDYRDSKQFKKNADLISKLIDLLVPYLLFKGYSLATIVETLRFWIRNGYHVTLKKLLSYFTFTTRSFTFLQCLGTRDEDVSDDFLDFLKSSLPDCDVEKLVAEDFGGEFLTNNDVKGDYSFAKYTVEVVDPYTHIRKNFDELLKRIVQQKERQNLAIFNTYFDLSFLTKKKSKDINRYRKIALEGDSINVNVRGRTLRRTIYYLETKARYDENGISEVKLKYGDCVPLRNAIYYYNLGLGSKSIENSLSLLWTSLEAIQPYKIYSSDIEAVQNYVSKALSMGAVARGIYGFAIRLIQCNKRNEGCFDGLGTLKFSPIEGFDGLVGWFQWLRDPKTCEQKFSNLKQYSELLAYEFFNIAKPLIDNDQSYLLDRIERSNLAIRYQLQRIYSHRNKIVHSGDMVNEYSNLWAHLEWYSGKMLAYFSFELFYEKNHKTLFDAFVALDADYSYLTSYLGKNKNRKISDLPERIIEILFKHSWAAY